MPRILKKKKFCNDLKKYQSRKGILEAIKTTIKLLEKGPPFPPNFINKPLKGCNGTIWDCHAQGDIVIVYEKKDDLIILTRVGSHSELFNA